MSDWKDHSVMAQSRTIDIYYLPVDGHNDMPGDDHPGARFVNPQVRVWEGPDAGEGDVIAEAMLNTEQPGLIVSAWSRDALANTQMVESIVYWAAQKGVRF